MGQFKLKFNQTLAMPKKIEKFARSMLVDPVVVNVGRAGTL